MSDKGTSKKVTRVDSNETKSPTPPVDSKPFVVSDENKAKAKQFRFIAIAAWVLAIGAEIGAIFLLKKVPVPMVWLIVLIVVDMILAIIGSLQWKKANRFDPASEKDKIRFFIQNQLGAIISIIAFLPLIILIFTNKNMTGKQKGIAGAVGIVALVVAGYFGIDFNPPSQEQYQQQTEQVKDLTGQDFVYWTKSGTRYHLYKDCHAINKDVTEEIFEGTVETARHEKNINELCSFCQNRANKEKEILPVSDSVQQ